MTEIRYGKTPQGQLIYDLAFVQLSDKWIARKHRIPIAEVRSLREIPAVRRLAKQCKKEGLRK